MSTILVVDDDRALCRSLELQLHSHGHEIISAFSAEDGLTKLQRHSPDLVLLDVHLPDSENLSILPRFLELEPSSVVVIITGDPDNLIISEAMRAGAFDYLRKPLDLDEVISVVGKATRHRLPGDTERTEVFSPPHSVTTWEIVGSSPGILGLHKDVGLLSRSNVAVLIEGETGTGKELAAHMLHESTSHGKPFVAINCSSIVPTLFESELFGHEKGAFTGADRLKVGKLEYAREGTVFLDEIGDLPPVLQGKLLRVLQEEEFVRVGGVTTLPLEARIIAATHRDLHALAKEGKYRKDLYYRLAVAHLKIPPLRERKEDIPMLVGYLLARIGRKLNRHIRAVEPQAMALLCSYNWPGNVRELENLLTKTIALSNSLVLTADDFPSLTSTPEGSVKTSDDIVSLAEAERRHVLKSLEAGGWNISRTARMLAISPTTLRKKIADYDLGPSRRQDDSTG